MGYVLRGVTSFAYRDSGLTPWNQLHLGTHYWRLHNPEAFKHVLPQVVNEKQLTVDKFGVALEGTEDISED